MSWPDLRILALFDIQIPIIQAPMAGPGTAALAAEVSRAGGLGSLPCAQLTPDQLRSTLEKIGPDGAALNLNFFCHPAPAADQSREQRWHEALSRYYLERNLEQNAPAVAAARAPFDEHYCQVVEQYRPRVVSFHFGLPPQDLLSRVKGAGAKIISSATTVAEALWLESRGCDAIIAMGYEAGGHRGSFLAEDMGRQVGTFALVPQVADAVKLPVIAAGGIADARGIVAAFALGASAVQIGTAYLFCPEARLTPVHRAALEAAGDDDTMLTNVFTGRPARGIVNRLMRELGAFSPLAPQFPAAATALAPLKAQAESEGSDDFSSLWSGQASRLAPRAVPAGELTRRLAAQALSRLSSRSSFDDAT